MKQLQKEITDACSLAAKLAVQDAARITLFVDGLLSGFAPLHGITKTWRPWVVDGALLLTALRSDRTVTVDRLIREYGGSLPPGPRSGRSVLRQALMMATDRVEIHDTPGVIPSTRGEAEATLASRIAFLLKLVPDPSAHRQSGVPELLEVRDGGESIEIVVDRPNPAFSESVARNAGRWERALGRKIGVICGNDTLPVSERMLLPSDSLAVAFGKIMMDPMRRLESRQYGLPLRDDPEFVHELRVCTRRMRAALRLFDHALGDWTREAEVCLSEMARDLGAVRDADVLCLFLRKYLDRCPEMHMPFVRDMITAIQRRARQRLRPLLNRVRSDEYGSFTRAFHKRLNGTLCRISNSGAMEPGREDMTVADKAPRFLKKRLKSVLRFSPPLARYTPEQLHRLRIACKRLRYVAEVFAPVYPGALKRISGTATDMQGFLGDIHDADIYRTAVCLYRRRRRKGGTMQVEDDAVRALCSYLDEWRADCLAKAESSMKVFVKGKGKRAALRLVRQPYPPRYPILNATGAGSIEIDGKTWQADVVVTADGRVSRRKDKRAVEVYGTALRVGPVELGRVICAMPKILYVGSGYDGKLTLTPEAQEYLRRRHIPFCLDPTPVAVERFNSEVRPRAAIMHVTC